MAAAYVLRRVALAEHVQLVAWAHIGQHHHLRIAIVFGQLRLVSLEDVDGD